MDNKLTETELVERYVLHQLNDEELALFRGRLMFDEPLRKQVVETKALMKNLQMIAKSDGFGAPIKTSTATTAINSSWSRQRLLRVTAVAAGIVLIAMIALRQNTASEEKVTIQKEKAVPKIEQAIDENTPIANEMENAEEEVTAPVKIVTPKSEETQKNQQSKPTIAKPSEESDEDERIFAEASPRKSSIDLSALAEEEMSMSSGNSNMGFADNQAVKYPQNEYLEDAIANSISKSSAINVLMKEQEANSFEKDKNGAIHIAYNGSIETKAKKSQYRFKIFTNDMDEYLDNMPKYQEHLMTSKVENNYTFQLDFKIDLPKGLYYYIIEEQVNDEYDMIYANKFIVK